MSEQKDDLWKAYAKGVKKIDAPSKKAALKTKAKKTISSPPAEEKDMSYPEEWTKMTEDTAPEIKTKKEKKQALIEKEKGRKKVANLPKEKKQPAPPAPEVKKDEPLDPRIERNLSLGDVFIEGKIDLHGKTEEEAYKTLCEFVEKQALAKKRVLLVITGRGKEGQSVLKKNVPRWCGVPPLSPFIRALRSAAPHHGGDGAYYILLKK